MSTEDEQFCRASELLLEAIDTFRDAGLTDRQIRREIDVRLASSAGAPTDD